jgi:hypothetical protein
MATDVSSHAVLSDAALRRRAICSWLAADHRQNPLMQLDPDLSQPISLVRWLSSPVELVVSASAWPRCSPSAAPRKISSRREQRSGPTLVYGADGERIWD